MLLKPIKNEIEYDLALNRVDELMEMNLDVDTLLSDELEILVILNRKIWRKTLEYKWTRSYRSYQSKNEANAFKAKRFNSI